MPASLQRGSKTWFLVVCLVVGRRLSRAEFCQTHKSVNMRRPVPVGYLPPVKLNLKLLAFLGASRIDSRHDVHKHHYGELMGSLDSTLAVSGERSQEVLEWLESLLRGFQGAGLTRTWCAQTFFPVSKALLTKETIWNASAAKRERVSDWQASVEKFSTYYSVTRHDFMARGGELLYLQLCNLFALDQTEVATFAKELRLSTNERNLEWLHQSLQDGLASISGRHTAAFDRLIEHIEMLDPVTHDMTNREDWLTCEWCPKESWGEALLFAVEMNRLLSAILDPVEQLELLMTGCALQVLRSLCAQSARYADMPDAQGEGGALDYSWVFSAPDSPSKQQRLASQRNLQTVMGLIQKALRSDDLRRNAGSKAEQLYKEADTKYGHKLFLSLGKKLGIIVPQKGPGARLVMTDSILRYLVLVLLRPGERCTYVEFLGRMYQHYGIAVEGNCLADAVAWSGLPVNTSVQSENGPWLARMLKAGGFLTELSDACSIVRNQLSVDLQEPRWKCR